MKNIHALGMHLYVTSSEEIKQGNWVFDKRDNFVYKIKLPIDGVGLIFKIILTTDPDLIKDGVQVIDDGFLQWFVKNPSCEEVEIKREDYVAQSNGKVSDGKITHEISLGISDNNLTIYTIVIPEEKSDAKEKIVEAIREELYEALQHLGIDFHGDFLEVDIENQTVTLRMDYHVVPEDNYIGLGTY